jgi:hypothetical protein
MEKSSWVPLIPRKQVDLSSIKRREPVRCLNRKCLRLFHPKAGGALFCCAGCQAQYEKDSGPVVHTQGLQNALDARNNSRGSDAEPSGCTCGAALDRESKSRDAERAVKTG